MANLAQNGVPTDNQSAWGLLQSSPLEGTSKIYLVKDILNNYDNILRYVINNKVNIDGLAAAPAFVNLQTQVNNSAVGTNLLLGTSKTLNTVTNVSGWNAGMPFYLSNVTTVNSDTPYTARAWISPVSHDMQIQVSWKDSSGNIKFGGGNTISAGTSGYSTWTGTIAAGSTIQYVTLVFMVAQPTDSSVTYGEVKLERGSVATDWCPNPEDLATSLQQGLDSKVNKTDYTNDLNNVHSSIGQAQTAAVNTSNSYTDKSTNDLKNSLPTFDKKLNDTDDLNNIQTNGTYCRYYSDTILKNTPTNEYHSKVGTLIVLHCGGSTDISQIWVTTVGDPKIYMRSLNGFPAAWSDWKRLTDTDDINNLQNQINGTGIGRTPIQWPNGVVTGGNGVYKLIKNNILYINGYGQFNVDTINNYVVANIPEANGRIIITALWVDSVSKDTVALKENGDIEFWGSDLKGKWFYINAAIPLI